MEWVKAAYWLGRFCIAVPFWALSGVLLGAIELGLFSVRLLGHAQLAVRRAGNWFAYGDHKADSVDLKIERRLDRLTMWRDK